MGIGPRELAEVRVYRGMPSSERDPIALWRRAGLVSVITRPLNYRDPVAPKEKGIDVQLAVDFVRLAIEGTFDAGVLFSANTDLLPALEAVCELKGAGACEVVAWAGPGGSPSILRLKDQRLRYHYLDRQWYDRLHDPTDSSELRRRR